MPHQTSTITPSTPTRLNLDMRSASSSGRWSCPSLETVSSGSITYTGTPPTLRGDPMSSREAPSFSSILPDVSSVPKTGTRSELGAAVLISGNQRPPLARRPNPASRPFTRVLPARLLWTLRGKRAAFLLREPARSRDISDLGLGIETRTQALNALMRKVHVALEVLSKKPVLWEPAVTLLDAAHATPRRIFTRATHRCV